MMTNKQLYAISKYLITEAALESQMQMGGTNQAVMLEKLEKDAGYLRSNSIMLRFVVILYLAFLILTPIQCLEIMKDAIARGGDLSWIYFITGMTMGFTFLLQIGILVMFQIYLAAGLVSRDGMQWLTTFPLNSDELRKIIAFAFWRSINYQIITLIVIFPVAIGIFTGDWVITLISLVLSILNGLMAFFLLIIFGEKVQRIINNNMNDSTTRKGGIFKVVFMAGYLVVVMVVVLSMNFAAEIFQNLFSQPNLLAGKEWLAIIPGLISFPFTNGFIIAGWLNPSILSPYHIISLGVGAIGWIFIIQWIFKKGLSVLSNIFHEPEEKITPKTETRIPISAEISQKADVQSISLHITLPMKAFLNKDKTGITRDMQMLGWVVVPFLYGVLAVFMGNDEPINMLTMFYVVISGVMLTYGFTKNDNEGATIMCCLPINPRDQAIAKLTLIMSIQFVGYVVPVFILIGSPIFTSFALSTLIEIFAGEVITFGFFLLWVREFGKTEYRYVVEEVVHDHKTAKWVLNFVLILAYIILIFAGFWELVDMGGLNLLAIIVLPAGFGIGLIFLGIFNYMFPKKVPIS